jgi:hypothetical protein
MFDVIAACLPPNFHLPLPLMQLFCCILNMSGDLFSVEIEKSESIDKLRGVIMKENSHAFVEVDARQIILWKVSGA